MVDEMHTQLLRPQYIHNAQENQQANRRFHCVIHCK
jgi:hypothetical protein